MLELSFLSNLVYTKLKNEGRLFYIGVNVINAPLLELYADKPGNFFVPFIPPILLIKIV